MKKVFGLGLILLVVLAMASFGLAAEQTVTVNIPATSTLTLSASTASITFPAIDTWASSTYTATSGNFNVLTFHNGSADPDIEVSAGALANGAVTLDSSRFYVYLTPQGGSEVNGSLDNTVTVSNIGKGRKTASAHYGLTIDDTQQSGTYTGTVTFTLLNQ